MAGMSSIGYVFRNPPLQNVGCCGCQSTEKSWRRTRKSEREIRRYVTEGNRDYKTGTRKSRTENRRYKQPGRIHGDATLVSSGMMSSTDFNFREGKAVHKMQVLRWRRWLLPQDTRKSRTSTPLRFQPRHRANTR